MDLFWRRGLLLLLVVDDTGDDGTFLRGDGGTDLDEMIVFAGLDTLFEVSPDFFYRVPGCLVFSF